jgi:hypothetical protein
MIYMKHKDHGNAHFPDGKQAELEAQGYVRWPRSKDVKVGIVPPVMPSSASTRKAMLDEADRRGLKVDGRWSDARLAEELSKV